jgi:hypothetical protein
MYEKFALVSAYKSDTTRNRRIEVSDDDHMVVVVAIKVEYKLIEDNFDHVHYSSDNDKVVLKTLYRDKDKKIYYKGAGKYSNYKTKEANSDKTYLNEEQMKELRDYLSRYYQQKYQKIIDRDAII